MFIDLKSFVVIFFFFFLSTGIEQDIITPTWQLSRENSFTSSTNVQSASICLRSANATLSEQLSFYSHSLSLSLLPAPHHFSSFSCFITLLSIGIIIFHPTISLQILFSFVCLLLSLILSPIKLHSHFPFSY